MAINFDKDLNYQLKRAVDNFNKKVARGKNQGIRYLPSKQSLKELKDEFKSEFAKKSELNRRLKELNNFSLKNAKAQVELESGEMTSKYNYDLAKKRQERLRKEIDKKIIQQEIYTKNAPELIMRRSRLSLLRNIKKSLLGDIKSRDVMRSINAHYNQEFSATRLDNFYDSFFEIMEQETKFIGFDANKLDYIKKRLKSIDPEILVEMRNNNPLISEVFERYDSDENYNIYDESALNELYNRIYNEVDSIILEFNDEEDYEEL